MDNQHRKIVGYRELTQDDINAMNKVKELGISIDAVVNETIVVAGNSDATRLAIDHLKTGLMWLTRSIAKPDFF